MSDFRFGCPHCGQRITGDAGYREQGLRLHAASIRLRLGRDGSPTRPARRAAR